MPGEPPPLEETNAPGPPPLEEALRTTPDLSPGLRGDGPRNPPDWRDLLRNPLILFGLGVVVVLLVTVIVILLTDGGEGSDPVLAVATSTPAVTPSPEPTPGTVAPDGVIALLTTTATVWNGPRRGTILGTLPIGATISLTGRNEDKRWLQFTFPAGSSRRGWIEAEFAEVTGNIDELPIEGRGPGPVIVLPTELPATITPTPMVTPTPTGTVATATPSSTTATPPTATATPPAETPSPLPSATPPPETETPSS